MTDQLFDTSDLAAASRSGGPQLRIVPSVHGAAEHSEWKLDERTIAIGRAGIAKARAALRKSDQTASERLAA